MPTAASARLSHHVLAACVVHSHVRTSDAKLCLQIEICRAEDDMATATMDCRPCQCSRAWFNLGRPESRSSAENGRGTGRIALDCYSVAIAVNVVKPVFCMGLGGRSICNGQRPNAVAGSREVECSAILRFLVLLCGWLENGRLPACRNYSFHTEPTLGCVPFSGAYRRGAD